MVTLEKPKNFLGPLPVLLVTVREEKDDLSTDNIIPISWAGTVDSNPHLVNINISRNKYSGNIIRKNKEFGICIPKAEEIEKIDICGTVHGDKVDKFKLAKFERSSSEEIDVSLIKQCPICMECRLEDILEFKSHDMFIGQIVKTHVSEEILDDDGSPDLSKVDILCYLDNWYWGLGNKKNKLFYSKGKG